MQDPTQTITLVEVFFLSFLSPAAVDIYDIVNGNSPHTHGLKAVKSPAPYMIGILDAIFDGSSSDVDAIEEAVD